MNKFDEVASPKNGGALRGMEIRLLIVRSVYRILKFMRMI